MEIFVGRNELIKQIEERLDDYSKESPIALIASGLPAIGRKTLLQHAMRKSNLVRDSYEFSIITLSALESIEDFILKIIGLGIVEVDSSTTLTTLNEKKELAKKLVRAVANEKERLLIEDHGVLVQSDGELVDWFCDLLSNLAPTSHLTFCVASQFRPNPSLNRTYPSICSIAVKELDLSERRGLLVRYARFHELRLERDELSFFSDILTGYPEQVLFAVDLIKDHGFFEAKRQSHTIQQYSSDRARVVLERYQNKKETLDFIYFLCRFEFLSYEVLFDIVDESIYAPILLDLLCGSICERLGTSSDHVRVNEVIRDFVSRNRFGLPTSFENSIKKHVERFIEHYSDDNFDISDYLFSAQEALKNGRGLPDNLVIPSVFVKAIKRLYDEERNYQDAIALADKVLQREGDLHTATVNHIRFIQCQSLARLRLKRFFDEVRHVSEPSRSFLYGFYYRLKGDYCNAEQHLLRALQNNKKKRDPRTLGELVLVYMQSDEYDKAIELARENYKNKPSNQINANNYFACLIMKDRTPEVRAELYEIIKRMEIDSSERAQEMVESMKARMVAYFDEKEKESFDLIEKTIQRYPKIDYPLLTKADLAAHFRNATKLREAVVQIERVTSKNAQSYRSFAKYKAMLLAIEGNIDGAKQLVQKELFGLNPSALQRLNERLEHLFGNRSSI